MTIIIPVWLVITILVLFVLKTIVRLNQINKSIKTVNELIKAFSGGSGIKDLFKMYMNSNKK